MIQIQEKKRGANGRLTFRKSKSITVYNVTLGGAQRRILNAFKGDYLGATRSQSELAFYDALETNDSAVQVLGDETLQTIARSY